jgi:hypothetical protein
MEVPCPGGGRSTKIRLEKILSSSSVKTQKGEYTLKNSDKQKMKNHLKSMERESEKFEKLMSKMQEKFGELFGELLSSADIEVKQ